jgi:hypothetical protein
MNWKDQLVDQFIPDLEPRVWVISDPDGVVRNEEILGRLQAKGFDTVFFEEPLAFRYEYESRIRPAWERGDTKPLIVLFDNRIDGFDGLPSDLLLSANSLTFGLRELFPQLDYDVLSELHPDQWTIMAESAAKTPGKVFRVTETEEMALRLCYRIVPELIDTSSELVRRLIELHRSNRALSPRLAKRLAGDLDVHSELKDWPVHALAMERSVFVQFLQKRWKRYIHKQTGAPVLDGQDLVAEPPDLAFDDPMLRGLIGSLFEDETLEPTDVEAGPLNEWWSIGVRSSSDNQALSSDRLEKLVTAIPEATASYRDWVQFGLRYSKVNSQVFLDDNYALKKFFWEQVWSEVNARFVAWSSEGYGSLHNLPSAPPVMVHHIPKQLARWRNEGEKVALLVLDGLSCAGWYSLRDSLLSRLEGEVSVNESAAFTWLPSLTPVCRQALFSGLAPTLFPETLKRTDRDGSRWKAFWESNGALLSKQIHHSLIGGDRVDLESVTADGALEGIQAFGMTISKPDEIMHGMTLGWAGWHQQLEVWNKTRFLDMLVNHLLQDGFTVCITADHGNLESVGTGKINEGVMAENRGQRVRVYPNEALRDAAYKSNQEVSHVFDAGMLPDGCFPIFATGRGAFVGDGDTIVAHGGTSLDELLVPWVVLRKGE